MSDAIILHTTADPERYFDMLSVTLPANRAFCLRHGIALHAFIGLRRGFHAWQACYNRLGFLRDCLAAGYRGWVVHLDADAFVADIGFDLRGYLDGQFGVAMIHPPGGATAPWDVNSGVFLWNFAHEATREVAAGWVARLDAVPDAALRAASLWNQQVPSDQPMLHAVLRARPDLWPLIRMEDAALLGYQQSRFIKQYVRNGVHGEDQRLVRIAREVALALRRAGGAPRVDGPAVVRAWELLRGQPPETLEAAFAALDAPDLGALRDRLPGG